MVAGQYFFKPATLRFSRLLFEFLADMRFPAAARQSRNTFWPTTT